MAWRKEYIETTRGSHIKLERDSIVSMIDYIPPGMRVVYLHAHRKTEGPSGIH